MAVDQVEERLRGAGLRVTAPRVAVLRALLASDDHPRVDQLIARVRASGVPISTQATYDVCEALHGAALARRIALAGRPVRFEARIGPDHHHLVCRACGHTADVAGSRPALSPGEAAGFLVDEAEITFWGLCPACRPNRPREGAHG